MPQGPRCEADCQSDSQLAPKAATLLQAMTGKRAGIAIGVCRPLSLSGSYSADMNVGVRALVE